jgi:hypothetical protein
MHANLPLKTFRLKGSFVTGLEAQKISYAWMEMYNIHHERQQYNKVLNSVIIIHFDFAIKRMICS